MDALDSIELYDCPLCSGPALLEEEDGWCLHVICLDCGCSTVNTGFNNEEERLKPRRNLPTCGTWARSSPAARANKRLLRHILQGDFP